MVTLAAWQPICWPALALLSVLRRFIQACFSSACMSYNFRRAVNGEIDVRDYPEVAQAARYQAAAMNIDFIPTKDMLGTGIADPEDVVEMVESVGEG